MGVMSTVESLVHFRVANLLSKYSFDIKAPPPLLIVLTNTNTCYKSGCGGF